jgi:transcription antitermination factor NusG
VRVNKEAYTITQGNRSLILASRALRKMPHITPLIEGKRTLDMKTWILLKTPANTLQNYFDWIQNRHPNIPLYYPVYEVLCRPSGHRRAIRVTRQTFPGYIFAKPDMNEGEHIALKHVPFRVWFIRFGPDIEVIPDHVITELKKLESSGFLAPQKNPRSLNPGTQVHVHLPSGDILGIVKKIIQTRAIIDTSFCSITVPMARITALHT